MRSSNGKKGYYKRGLKIPVEVFKNKNPTPSKLDPFKEIIDGKLKLSCTAMSVFKFLPKKGFSGVYTIGREYCRTKKYKEIKKAMIRVETFPVTAVQFDWREDMDLHHQFGNAHKFSLFLYVLHYSKLKFIILTWNRKQDTLFSCLSEAFEYTGGVPREIWFDNMRTVLLIFGKTKRNTPCNQLMTNY